ncbi:Ppx/GppA phosphatase [Vitreoscilla sp. C1]|uniref:exopolyphosphatase n=1 Tax=Vitreoscilla sp. (strain C1) TaxID=96942 RepID=UPI00148EE090|nr:exopolyphosphatase [Vitreoscilla sp. C1]AUZ04002.2 Ppx/GppA phosphatase [Vitreoscilla sp. C1]
MPLSSILATVDLGSNSFRVQICAVENGQLRVIDSLKEMVRFAGGLDENKNITVEAQERALECLSRFGQRLQGLKKDQVRVVATNTFRVAKNIQKFLPKAEATLGFPIQIIAGREEARLIYLGVKHTQPPTTQNMLVVDIGGGSTEFVIGNDLQPDIMESLPLGCVSYSTRFFPDGKVTAERFEQAVASARIEIQRISQDLKQHGWDFAIGSSGSARSIRDVIDAYKLSKHDLDVASMRMIAKKVINAGSTRKAKLLGMKSDRIEVFAGGLAVMVAVFEELNLDAMSVTDAALRDGVFFDMMGRDLERDLRDETVELFQSLYHVDVAQANRVKQIAKQCFAGLSQSLPNSQLQIWNEYLDWAASLHEVGMSIAHSGYHKHSAYILDHADMFGFSRQEQHLLAVLVLSHRGDIKKLVDVVTDEQWWPAVFAMRLAALFCRSRKDLIFPDNTSLYYDAASKTCVLQISAQWLQDNPLIAGSLAQEVLQWHHIQSELKIEAITP